MIKEEEIENKENRENKESKLKHVRVYEQL